MKANVLLVPLNLAVLQEDLQSRADMDAKHIDDMRLWLIEHPKADLPAVKAILADGLYLIWDGWHRRHAYQGARRMTIPVEFTEGTEREAKLLACSANGDQNSLRRTNEDKQKAVRILLTDDEWGKWSDHKIAELAGVTQPFVSKMRALITVITGEESRETVKGKDGRTQRNPAHTKRISLGRNSPAPCGDDGQTADDGRQGARDAVNLALVHMDKGDEWVKEASRCLAAAGRESQARSLLDDIKRAMHHLRKTLAGEKAA